MGLVSDGGVHAHINHLSAICDYCKANGLNEIYIHAFTDGRDTDPKSGLSFITTLTRHLQNSVGKIATISGRYYAMDRDKRWERVKLAYDAMVNGLGARASSATDAIKNAYAENTTDEFIKPLIITGEDNQPLATIAADDAVICFNFRTDRCREISEALTQKDFPEFAMHKLALAYTTMTEYDSSFNNVHVIFRNDNLTHTLGDTGVWEAAVKAVETVDTCVKQVVEAALENDYTVFLTADHGNADFMKNEDGSPNTAHTLNPVPLFIIDKDWKGEVKPGKLGDIAPTILHFMGLPIPAEMTGDILVD